MAKQRIWSLGELASEAGVPARTIRFYISRGLVAGPLRGGRGAVYSDDHLARLKTIQKLQAKGLMLAEVARVLGGGERGDAIPAPSTWWNYPIAEDVVVSVRAGQSPWRLRQVRAALSEMAARLKASAKEGEEKDASDR